MKELIEELRNDIKNLMSHNKKIDMPEGEPMYGISPYHIEKIQIKFNNLIVEIEKLEELREEVKEELKCGRGRGWYAFEDLRIAVEKSEK